MIWFIWIDKFLPSPLQTENNIIEYLNFSYVGLTDFINRSLPYCHGLYNCINFRKIMNLFRQIKPTVTVYDHVDRNTRWFISVIKPFPPILPSHLHVHAELINVRLKCGQVQRTDYGSRYMSYVTIYAAVKKYLPYLTSPWTVQVY